MTVTLDRHPPEILDDFTRRRFVAGGLGLGAIILAGCGGEDPDAASTTESGGSFPVTVEHKFGSVEITEDPQRIVAVGFNDADVLLAFGKTPVGTRGPTDYPYERRPWAQDALGGVVPEVVGTTELNFEKVAALRPDLILGIYSGMTENDYAKLSQIAPTVAQTDEFVDFGMPWQQQTQLTGRALGREARARDLIAEAEDVFARARRAHPAFDGLSAVLASPDKNGYFAFSSDDLRVRFFTSLGFEVPEEIADLAGDAFFAELSGERIRLIDQDVVIVFGTQEDLRDDPLFQRLDAVREGRVIYLPTGTPDLYGALNYNTTLSLPFQIDGFVPRLAAAVDGDPATAVAPIR